MKSILLSVLIALAGGVLFGQDYFVVGKKTTYCSNLAYTTTAQGYLKTMTYVTEEGKTVSLQGRDNVPDVTTFFINGEYFDKVPLNANKPDKYIRYDKREINGKLIVYLERQGYIAALIGSSSVCQVGSCTRSMTRRTCRRYLSRSF
jgi:hypothetical protein